MTWLFCIDPVYLKCPYFLKQNSSALRRRKILQPGFAALFVLHILAYPVMNSSVAVHHLDFWSWSETIPLYMIYMTLHSRPYMAFSTSRLTWYQSALRSAYS